MSFCRRASYFCIAFSPTALWALSAASLLQTPQETSRGAWPLGLESEFVLPEGRELTGPLIALGERLFFDRRLSRDGSLACASCHRPDHAFAGDTKTAVGIGGKRGRRNAPSVANRLFGSSQFWDGRARTLEEQALGPLFSPEEMGMDERSLLQFLTSDPYYSSKFPEVLGAAPSTESLASAIASFERTLLSGNSPFDRYEWGGEKSSLTESAIQGLQLFRGKARCTLCHMGFTFTDERYHAMGIPGDDEGRFAITQRPEDRGAFKTPSLRNVASTAPYMHDGSLPSLQDVIEFYDEGGGKGKHKDERLSALGLSTEEKASLLEFLCALTSSTVSVTATEVNRVGIPH